MDIIHHIPANQCLRLQKFQGLFLAPMILQTFATHFSAILGAVKMPSPQVKENEGHGALALSVTAASTPASFSHRVGPHSYSKYVANLGGTSAHTLARRIDHYRVP